MNQFDTLSTQCIHIEHMHEGVLFKSNYIDKRTSKYQNDIQIGHLILTRFALVKKCRLHLKILVK